uniref:Uncharacterized protein n=1 Tax=Leersia perrieri TaxID=77586 RepID=A0A0D9WFR6_9ORYZ
MTKTLTRSWSRVVLDELNRDPDLPSPMDEPNLDSACFIGRYNDDRRVRRRQAGVPRPGCRSEPHGYAALIDPSTGTGELYIAGAQVSAMPDHHLDHTHAASTTWTKLDPTRNRVPHVQAVLTEQLASPSDLSIADASSGRRPRPPPPPKRRRSASGQIEARRG